MGIQPQTQIFKIDSTLNKTYIENSILINKYPISCCYHINKLYVISGFNNVTNSNEIDIYSLLNANKIVFSKDAIKNVETLLK